MDVVAYIRVSTINQVKDGYGLDTQRQKIIDYCRSHKRNILKWYSDKGISGAKANEEALEVDRPGLQEMLAELPKLKAKKVIVLNTSRLWRDSIPKILIQRELKKLKMDVLSVEQPTYSIYNQDPNDFLVNGMFELLDSYERMSISLKLKRGRMTKAKSGGFAGGKRPLGYRKKGSDLIIDDQEAQTIKRIFYLKRYKKMSLRAICEALTKERRKTKNGGKWHANTVNKVLNNPLYRGWLSYSGLKSKRSELKLL